MAEDQSGMLVLTAAEQGRTVTGSSVSPWPAGCGAGDSLRISQRRQPASATWGDTV